MGNLFCKIICVHYSAKFGYCAYNYWNYEVTWLNSQHWFGHIFLLLLEGCVCLHPLSVSTAWKRGNMETFVVKAYWATVLHNWSPLWSCVSNFYLAYSSRFFYFYLGSSISTFWHDPMRHIIISKLLWC